MANKFYCWKNQSKASTIFWEINLGYNFNIKILLRYGEEEGNMRDSKDWKTILRRWSEYILKDRLLIVLFGINLGQEYGEL